MGRQMTHWELERIEQIHRLIESTYKYNRDTSVANTLDFNMYALKRRGGNTTKQIDYAIDALFNGCIVICLDHHQAGAHHEANLRLMDLISFRLYHEHRLDRKRDIVWDRGRYTMMLHGSVLTKIQRTWREY